MISEVCNKRISEPAYYHREYKNDIGKKAEEPSWARQCQRAALVALPFFSLYKPLSLPISLGMGALRTFSSASELFASIKQGNAKDVPFHLLKTTIAVIALAGTIFAHPLGMLITTSYDIIAETLHLIEHLQKGEYEKALVSCANIINNALYLALFTHGGIEIALASLAVQIMLGIYHSQDEFRKGNYLEGMGHLLMSMTRGCALAGQAKLLTNLEKQKVIDQDIDLERNIANQLRGVLSEGEMHTLLQQIHHRQKVDPHSTLILFATMRGEKNAFSSSDVKEIARVLSPYDENWKGLEWNQDFWKNFSLAAFGKSNQFPEESEHFNYEAQRLIHSIHHQLSDNQPVSTNYIENLLNSSLISESNGQEKLWKLAHGLAYEREEPFLNETWKENFDIAYQTQAFNSKMQEIRSTVWFRPEDADLIKTINEFPKTSRICLKNFTHISSHSLHHAIMTSHKYLRDFDSTNCGKHDYLGLDEYVSINNSVVDALAECKELRSIYGNWRFEGRSLESVTQNLLSNCPMLERAELYNPYWYHNQERDLLWSFTKNHSSQRV